MSRMFFTVNNFIFFPPAEWFTHLLVEAIAMDYVLVFVKCFGMTKIKQVLLIRRAEFWMRRIKLWEFIAGTSLRKGVRQTANSL